MGMTPSEQDRGVYHVGEGITGKVVESAEPIIVRRIGSEPAFLNRTGSLALERDKDMSFICVPIRHGRKVAGRYQRKPSVPHRGCLATACQCALPHGPDAGPCR